MNLRRLSRLAIFGLAAACTDNDQNMSAVSPVTDTGLAESAVDDSVRLDREQVRDSNSRLPNRRDDEETLLWASIPILPGVREFRLEFDFLSTANPLGIEAPLKLAAEEWDRAWAEDMENRIRSEITSNVNEPVTQIDVVCRTTMCGLLFLMPPGTINDGESFDERWGISDSLKRALNLRRIGSGAGSSPDRQFYVIYVETDP